MSLIENQLKQILARSSTGSSQVTAATKDEAVAFVKKAAAKHLKGFKVTLTAGENRVQDVIEVDVETNLGDLNLILILDADGSVFLDTYSEPDTPDGSEFMQDGPALMDLTITGKKGLRKLESNFTKPGLAWCDEMAKALADYRAYVLAMSKFLAAINAGKL